MLQSAVSTADWRSSTLVRAAWSSSSPAPARCTPLEKRGLALGRILHQEMPVSAPVTGDALPAKNHQQFPFVQGPDAGW